MSETEKNENTPWSCPPSLLKKIDEAAKNSTLNRSAWLRIAAMEKMERDCLRRTAVAQELEY